MKTLTCDVCRHTMKEPVVNRNYYHICRRDICQDCKDDLERSITPTVMTKSPFNYEWYTRLVLDNVEKAIQRGKF